MFSFDNQFVVDYLSIVVEDTSANEVFKVVDFSFNLVESAVSQSVVVIVVEDNGDFVVEVIDFIVAILDIVGDLTVHNFISEDFIFDHVVVSYIVEVVKDTDAEVVDVCHSMFADFNSRKAIVFFEVVVVAIVLVEVVVYVIDV